MYIKPIFLRLLEGIETLFTGKTASSFLLSLVHCCRNVSIGLTNILFNSSCFVSFLYWNAKHFKEQWTSVLYLKFI